MLTQWMAEKLARMEAALKEDTNKELVDISRRGNIRMNVVDANRSNIKLSKQIDLSKLPEEFLSKQRNRDLIMTMILSGRETNPTRLSSYLISALNKPVHEGLHYLLSILLFGTWYTETTLEDHVKSWTGSNKRFHQSVTSSEAYQYCYSQTPDVCRVVENNQCMQERLQILKDLGFYVECECDLERAGGMIMLYGDVFTTSGNIEWGQVHKNKRYYQLEVILARCAAYLGVTLVKIHMGFKRDSQSIEKVSRDILLGMKNFELPLNIQNLPRALSNLVINSEEYHTKCCDLFGAAAVKSIMLSSGKKDTTMSVGDGTVESIYRSCRKNRVAANTREEFNRVIGEANDEECNLINCSHVNDASHQVVGHIVTETFNAIHTGTRQSRILSEGTTQKLEIEKAIQETQREQKSTALAKENKAISSIPWLEVPPHMLSPKLSNPKEFCIDGDMVNTYPYDRDNILVDSMDDGLCRRIVHQIVKGIPLKNANIRNNVVLDNLTTPFSRFLQDLLESISTSRKSVSSIVSYLPVDLFEPTFPLNRAISILSDTLNIKNRGDWRYHNLRTLVVTNFKLSGSSKPKEKRIMKFKQNKSSVIDRAVVGIDVREAKLKSHFSKEKKSTYVPFSLDNDAIPKAIAMMKFQDRIIIKSPGYDESVSDLSRKLENEFRRGSTRVEEASIKTYCNEYSKYFHTSVGKATSFLHVLALQLGADMGRKREKHDFNFSCLSDNLFLCVFGQQVTSGSRNDFVNYILLSYGENKLLPCAEVCTNNYSSYEAKCYGEPVRIYASSLLSMPRFAINSYVTMFYTIKQSSDMYISLSPPSAFELRMSNPLNKQTDPKNNNTTIPETLFLIACRLTLNTALIQSLTRYVGMHKLSRSDNFTAFAKAKYLNIPMRHQSDVFLIQRSLKYLTEHNLKGLNKAVLQVFTEDNGKFIKNPNKTYNVPSIMFDRFGEIPDTDLDFASFYTKLYGVNNVFNLGSNLTALPQEFYFMTIFSRSVENITNDDRTVLLDGVKLEYKVREKRYEGSDSQKNFLRLQELIRNDKEDSGEFRFLMSEHYHAERLSEHNLDYQKCLAGVKSGLDFNMYYNLNGDTTFNMYDTGLTKSGLMSDALCKITDLIHQGSKPTCDFSAVCLAVGKQFTIEGICDRRGEHHIHEAIKENKENSKSLSVEGTQKSTVVANHERPLPVETIGMTSKSMKSYIRENMGVRTKRNVTALEMLLAMNTNGSERLAYLKDAGKIGTDIEESISRYSSFMNLISEETIKRKASFSFKDRLKKAEAYANQTSNPVLLMKVAVDNMSNEVDEFNAFDDETAAMIKKQHSNLKEYLSSDAFQSTKVYEEAPEEFRKLVEHNRPLVEECIPIQNLKDIGNSQLQEAIEKERATPEALLKAINIKILKIKNDEDNPKMRSHRIKNFQDLKKKIYEGIRSNKEYKNYSDAKEVRKQIDHLMDIISAVSSMSAEHISLLSDEMLIKYFTTVKMLKSLYSNRKNNKVLNEFFGSKVDPMAPLLQAKAALESLETLEEMSREEVALSAAAVFSLNTSLSYMIAQWFKKAQLIGIRPISIFDANTATQIHAVENISHSFAELDPRNTMAEPNKVSRFTGIINQAYGFIREEASSGKYTDIIASDADCKGWCNEKTMGEFSALLGPNKMYCSDTSKFCRCVVVKNYVKAMEIPSEELISWLNLNKDPKSYLVHNEKTDKLNKKFLIDLVPIIVITSGMLQGVFNKLSTETQASACSLKEQCFKEAVNRLRHYDARLDDFSYKCLSLFGSDDLFDVKPHSFSKLETLLSKADENPEAKREIKEIKELLLDLKTANLNKLLKSRMGNLSPNIPVERIINCTDVDEAERLLLERLKHIEEDSCDRYAKMFETRPRFIMKKKDAEAPKNFQEMEKVDNLPDSKPITDAELSNMLNELYLQIQEICLNLCNCNLSEKTALCDLILEYNSIFCSAEGQNNCRIKFLIAANSMFSVSSPVQSVEEIVNKLRQMSENYTPDTLYWNTLLSQEWLFNRFYNFGPNHYNAPEKIFGVRQDIASQMYYGCGIFPRLSQHEVCTEGISYAIHKTSKSEHLVARESLEMFYLNPDHEVQDDEEISETKAESFMMQKIETTFNTSRSYDNFMDKLSKQGINKELLELLIKRNPAIGVGRSNTVLDEAFRIIQNFFSAGAKKSFRTNTSEGDLRVLYSSLSAAMYKLPGSDPAAYTYANCLKHLHNMYTKYKQQTNKEISINRVKTNGASCEALDRVREFLKYEADAFRVTQDVLPNVRSVKCRTRTEQLVGEVPMSDYLLKHWWNIEPSRGYTKGAYDRTRYILSLSCPKFKDDYNTFLEEIGLTNFKIDGDVTSMTPMQVEDNYEKIVKLRSLTKFMVEKCTYKTDFSKVFTKFSATSTLDEFIKRMITTTHHPTNYCEILRSDFTSLQIKDKRFSNLGKVKDLCALCWNFISLLDSEPECSAKVMLNSLSISGQSCVDVMNSISLPGGLAEYKSFTMSEKSALFTMLELTGRLTDNRLSSYKILCSDFSRKGNILVLKGSSKNPRRADFACVNILGSGCVRFNTILSEDKNHGYNILATSGISGADLNEGIKGCLSFYLNKDKTENPSKLLKLLEKKYKFNSSEVWSANVKKMYIINNQILRGEQVSTTDHVRAEVYQFSEGPEARDIMNSLDFDCFSMSCEQGDINFNVKVSGMPEALLSLTTPFSDGDNRNIVLRRLERKPFRRDLESVADPNKIASSIRDLISKGELFDSSGEGDVEDLLYSSTCHMSAIKMASVGVCSNKLEIGKMLNCGCYMDPSSLVEHVLRTENYNREAQSVISEIYSPFDTVESKDAKTSEGPKSYKAIDTDSDSDDGGLGYFNFSSSVGGPSSSYTESFRIVEDEHGEVTYEGKKYELKKTSSGDSSRNLAADFVERARSALSRGLRSIMLRQVEDNTTVAYKSKFEKFRAKTINIDNVVIPTPENHLEDLYSRYFIILASIVDVNHLGARNYESLMQLFDFGFFTMGNDARNIQAFNILSRYEFVEDLGRTKEKFLDDYHDVMNRKSIKDLFGGFQSFRIKFGVRDYTDNLIMMMMGFHLGERLMGRSNLSACYDPETYHMATYISKSVFGELITVHELKETTEWDEVKSAYFNLSEGEKNELIMSAVLNGPDKLCSFYMRSEDWSLRTNSAYTTFSRLRAIRAIFHNGVLDQKVRELIRNIELMMLFYKLASYPRENTISDLRLAKYLISKFGSAQDFEKYIVLLSNDKDINRFFLTDMLRPESKEVLQHEKARRATCWNGPFEQTVDVFGKDLGCYSEFQQHCFSKIEAFCSQLEEEYERRGEVMFIENSVEIVKGLRNLLDNRNEYDKAIEGFSDIKRGFLNIVGLSNMVLNSIAREIQYEPYKNNLLGTGELKNRYCRAELVISNPVDYLRAVNFSATTPIVIYGEFGPMTTFRLFRSFCKGEHDYQRAFDSGHLKMMAPPDLVHLFAHFTPNVDVYLNVNDLEVKQMKFTLSKQRCMQPIRRTLCNCINTPVNSKLLKPSKLCFFGKKAAFASMMSADSSKGEYFYQLYNQSKSIKISEAIERYPFCTPLCMLTPLETLSLAARVMGARSDVVFPSLVDFISTRKRDVAGSSVEFESFSHITRGEEEIEQIRLEVDKEEDYTNKNQSAEVVEKVKSEVGWLLFNKSYTPEVESLYDIFRMCANSGMLSRNSKTTERERFLVNKLLLLLYYTGRDIGYRTHLPIRASDVAKCLGVFKEFTPLIIHCIRSKFNSTLRVAYTKEMKEIVRRALDTRKQVDIVKCLSFFDDQGVLSAQKIDETVALSRQLLSSEKSKVVVQNDKLRAERFLSEKVKHLDFDYWWINNIKIMEKCLELRELIQDDGAFCVAITQFLRKDNQMGQETIDNNFCEAHNFLTAYNAVQKDVQEKIPLVGNFMRSGQKAVLLFCERLRELMKQPEFKESDLSYLMSYITDEWPEDGMYSYSGIHNFMQTNCMECRGWEDETDESEYIYTINFSDTAEFSDPKTREPVTIIKIKEKGKGKGKKVEKAAVSEPEVGKKARVSETLREAEASTERGLESSSCAAEVIPTTKRDEGEKSIGKPIQLESTHSKVIKVESLSPLSPVRKRKMGPPSPVKPKKSTARSSADLNPSKAVSFKEGDELKPLQLFSEKKAQLFDLFDPRASDSSGEEVTEIEKIHSVQLFNISDEPPMASSSSDDDAPPVTVEVEAQREGILIQNEEIVRPSSKRWVDFSDDEEPIR